MPRRAVPRRAVLCACPPRSFRKTRRPSPDELRELVAALPGLRVEAPHQEPLRQLLATFERWEVRARAGSALGAFR